LNKQFTSNINKEGRFCVNRTFGSDKGIIPEKLCVKYGSWGQEMMAWEQKLKDEVESKT